MTIPCRSSNSDNRSGDSFKAMAFDSLGLGGFQDIVPGNTLAITTKFTGITAGSVVE